MYYVHIKSNTLYKFMYEALFQNEKGEWVESVVYENEEGMKFVRLREDFDKSFVRKWE